MLIPQELQLSQIISSYYYFNGGILGSVGQYGF